MRIKMVAMAMPVAVLVACGPSSPATGSPTAVAVAKAYQAYREGTFSEVERLRDEVEARVPSDPAVVTACTLAGYQARHDIRALDRLRQLTSSAATSLPETGRLIYLDSVTMSWDQHVQRPSHDDWPLDFTCEKSPEYDASRRFKDGDERIMNEDARTALRDWRTALKAELGAEYEARMNQSARLLHNNHLRSGDTWSDNENY